MTVSQFEHIAKSISPFTSYIYLHVKGEPLLHPELSSILEICDKFNLQVNITTNGTKLAEVKEVLYTSTALRQINISLHSFEQIDVSMLSELNIYLKNVFEITRYLRENSKVICVFRLWNLDKNNLTIQGRERNSYVLERLEQEFSLDFALLEAEKNVNLGNQTYLNYDYEFPWPSLQASYKGNQGYCYGLKTHIGILVNGSVVPCCLDNDGVVTLGNIFNETLYEILSNERATNISFGFAQRKVVEELCQRCGYRERFNSMGKRTD